MTQFTLDLYDWLSQKPGVSELRDESTLQHGDAISCCFAGKHHFITVDHANSVGYLSDPREAALEDEHD